MPARARRIALNPWTIQSRVARSILDDQPTRLRRTTDIVSRWRCSTNARAFTTFAFDVSVNGERSPRA